MLLQQTASVLFDDGIKVFVCFCEGVEWVRYERWVAGRFGEREYVEEDFRWESVQLG